MRRICVCSRFLVVHPTILARIWKKNKNNEKKAARQLCARKTVILKNYYFTASVEQVRVIMCVHTISVNGGKADEKVIVLCVQYG